MKREQEEVEKLVGYFVKRRANVLYRWWHEGRRIVAIHSVAN